MKEEVFWQELQPVRKTHMREVDEGLYPVGVGEQWRREGVAEKCYVLTIAFVAQGVGRR